MGKRDKGKAVLVAPAGEEIEGGRQDNSTSKIGLIDSHKLSQVADLMGSENEEVMYVGTTSIPVDLVMQQQVVEADVAMGNETEKMVINCKKIVGKTCDPSHVRNNDTSIGPQPDKNKTEVHVTSEISNPIPSIPSPLFGLVLDSVKDGPILSNLSTTRPVDGLDNPIDPNPLLKQVAG
ncbi:hypothetical protein QYF36_018287 [Acer negundo]|nr:hypothetical protein QYF36_018287 [Acer negundo]